MTFVLWAWSLLLGGIFVLSSVSKLLDLRGLRNVLQYTLRLKSSRSRAVAPAVAVVELALGLAILFTGGGRFYYVGFGGATLVLIAFTVWAMWAMHRGYVVSCACFGPRSSDVSWRTVARNIALITGTIACGTAAALEAQSRGQLGLTGRLIVAVTIAGATSGVAAYWFVKPYLMTAGQVRAQIAAAEGGGT